MAGEQSSNGAPVLIGEGFAGKLDHVRILPAALPVVAPTTKLITYGPMGGFFLQNVANAAGVDVKGPTDNVSSTGISSVFDAVISPSPSSKAR